MNSTLYGIVYNMHGVHCMKDHVEINLQKLQSYVISQLSAASWSSEQEVLLLA